MGIGVDNRTVINVGGLESCHRNHLQAWAGGQNVSQFCPSEFNDWDFSGDRDLMSHCDEIRNPILGRLKVCIFIIIIIVIVIINNFAPGEQAVSC